VRDLFIEFSRHVCFNVSTGKPMNSLATISESKLPSDGERAALLKLLTDDDPAVYRTVRTRILSCGPAAREWLRPHSLSCDPVLRRRSREIVQHFASLDADTQFLSFCLKHGEDFDLEEGVWLLVQTNHPDINVEAYQAVLDGYAAELRERIEPGASGKETLRVINEYLFKELGFTGNEIAYYDPQNNYLNRVMDRRTGNPINLSLLYLLLARRLRLPMAGVGLPGHFICRYQSASEEIFIDAFNRGKLLTKIDCNQFLSHVSEDARAEFLTPASARRILTRICNNLHQIYRQLGLREETLRLHRYLVALAR
jgi:regulator of sirC expression with transglutaminase-like and TPR domain